MGMNYYNHTRNFNISSTFLSVLILSVFGVLLSKESYETNKTIASSKTDKVLTVGLQLPPIFASGMVLQQEDSVTIWGKGDRNSNIVVETGWDGIKYNTVTDSEGKWSVQVITPLASFSPYKIVISDEKKKFFLKDILIGDVWFVSGQSNMYESFRGFMNQPVNNAQEFLLNHGNVDGIRLFRVEQGNALHESDTIRGEWVYAKIDNVIDFSAVGFIFGKTVFDYVNIPIGLVQCAYSGSLAEAWLDKESLKELGGFDLRNIVIKTKGLGTSQPTLQYNSMLHPLLPLRIKGIIWYQGEANVKDPQTYKKLFPFLIKKWREYFNNNELPFYYVQIAPYSYDYAPNLESQYIREVQLNTMKDVANTGMAVILDIGSKDKIHPPEKGLVGRRLAYWALNKTYGVNSITCRGPEYRSMKVKEGNVILKFDYANGGLSTFGKDLTGFEVAGENKIFYKANAVIEIEKGTWESVIRVWSEKVPHPVAVRYGFTNYIEGSLYNIQGLPASSFRTDDW